MTITIHITSIFVGFIIGLLSAVTLVAFVIYKSGGAWDIGFSQGWESAEKYYKSEVEKT